MTPARRSSLRSGSGRARSARRWHARRANGRSRGTFSRIQPWRREKDCANRAKERENLPLVAMKTDELFNAIRQNDAAAVAALLDEDHALLSATAHDITPILFAVYYGHPELAQLFVERGA